MKKLTPKQRREIYLKVAIYQAEKVGSINFDNALCRNLCKAARVPNKGVKFDFETLYKVMPEFFLFAPDDYLEIALWFSGNDERVICMLLCAEMCNL